MAASKCRFSADAPCLILQEQSFQIIFEYICVHAQLQEVKQTNFFQELRFMLYTYRSVYILFGLIIPLAFVVMSGVVPFVPIPHGMSMRNAYLLVPVGILCFGHTMGPILLSPPLMLVKF